MGTSPSEPSRWTIVARGEAQRGGGLAERWIAPPAGAAERIARRPSPRPACRGRREEPPELRATMPGKVLAVLVALGDAVVAGQDILVVEAMKMENAIGAPRDGVVQKLAVQPGQAVESGELLAVIA